MTVVYQPSKNPCEGCGKAFEIIRQRGRPPVRCQPCREVKLEEKAESAALAISQVDPDTLFSGDPKLLLGTPFDLPRGAEAQCMIRGCGRIFTSNSACDSHRDFRSNPVCSDPAAMGMVPKERRGLPIWTRPTEKDVDGEA